MLKLLSKLIAVFMFLIVMLNFNLEFENNGNINAIPEVSIGKTALCGGTTCQYDPGNICDTAYEWRQNRCNTLASALLPCAG